MEIYLNFTGAIDRVSNSKVFVEFPSKPSKKGGSALSLAQALDALCACMHGRLEMKS